MTNHLALIEDLTAALHNAIRIIDHKDGTDHIDTGREVLERAQDVLTATTRVPLNCWLDDEYPCPSACVFDDPDDPISNCVYAVQLEAEQKPKTCCRHYRDADV